MHQIVKYYMQKYQPIIAFFLSVFLFSCQNFEYHPYAADIDGPGNINENNIKRIQAEVKTLPVKFAFMTDTQGAYNELDEAMRHISANDGIDFIVHGGDISDFGLPKEFVWCRDIMDGYNIPYFAVIGNHDCQGSGENAYEYIFGLKNYSFNVAGIHFLCLNTNALEYDYSNPVPDLNFIEADAEEVVSLNKKSPGAVTHTIVVMHSRPYDRQFNNNVAKPFIYYLKQFPGMGESDPVIEDGTRRFGFCLNGHNHSTAITDIDDEGILFYQCANIGKRNYFIVTVKEDGYDVEVVEF